MAAAVSADRLGKLYRVGPLRERHDTYREAIVAGARAAMRRASRLVTPRPSGAGSEARFLWALRDASFEVEHGEVLGIVGPNGAGKTTLLKILSRITVPTEGRAEITGRVGALLQMGTGFHPELTGRENMMLSAAIMGLRRAELRAKFDAIVAFAGIERFIDTPVKRYSSGMYVRLAFSVAAHLEPDILLVDEILAVGDAAFQEKCLGRMDKIATGGRTVLFVSHNMAAVEALCSRAILLRGGEIQSLGPARDIVSEYLGSEGGEVGPSLSERPDREGDGRIRLVDIQFVDNLWRPYRVLASGRSVRVVVEYVAREVDSANISLGISVYDIRGQRCLYLENEMAGWVFSGPPTHGQLVCSIDSWPLAPGAYYVNLYCTVNGVVADWVQRARFVTVVPGDFYGTGKLPPEKHGGFLVPQRWELVFGGGGE